MNYQRIVCLDLEMCCWDDGRDPRTGEIIEFGLAEVDLIEGKVIKRAQYYVKPDTHEVSEFCTELTGITQKIVDKQGRPFADVLATVTKNFGGKTRSMAPGDGMTTLFVKSVKIRASITPSKSF